MKSRSVEQEVVDHNTTVNLFSMLMDFAKVKCSTSQVAQMINL